VTRSVCSSTVPAWQMIPVPSADTSIRGGQR